MLKFFITISCFAVVCCALENPLKTSTQASAFQAPGGIGSLAKTSRASSSNMFFGDAAETEAAPAPAQRGRAAPAPSGSSSDLEELAVSLNPIVGYWDPLGLGKQQFWGQDNAATVGFLRHAEIKHGRVAMAAFVGFCVQSNFYWPWKLTGEIDFADIAAAGGPPAQWDALPTAAKVQILLFIGFLELWSETSTVLEKDGSAHYMRGGVPGKYPRFNGNPEGSTRWMYNPKYINQGSVPHPTLNLYDPFGLNDGKSREELDKSLLAEINNGRLAQIGIFGMLSTTKGLIVPGLDAIPGIKDQAYTGEIMAPFSANDKLPFLDELLKINPVIGNPFAK